MDTSGMNITLLTNSCFLLTEPLLKRKSKIHQRMGQTQNLAQTNFGQSDSQSISPPPTCKKVGQVLEISWFQE